jgi:hypothetical protein
VVRARSARPPLRCAARRDPAAQITAGLVVALGISGCAGWRGDTYFARNATEATYAIAQPGAPWTPAPRLEGVQVAWAHPDIGAVVEVHGECEVHGDAPLPEYLDHLRIGWTEWVVVSQEERTVLGRAALHAVVTARLDGVPRSLEFLVLKKNGCVLDVRLSAPPQHFDTGRAAFDRVTAGLQFPAPGAGRGRT